MKHDKIKIKTPQEIELMKKSGNVLSACHDMLAQNCRAGITTGELDKLAEEFIRSHGGIPTFLGYGGFPGTCCISINDEVVHGIPGKRVIQDGDIVSIDCGVTLNGWVSDAARTHIVGEVPEDVRRLVKVTEECLYLGIAQAKAGNYIRDIGVAVQDHAEKNGFGVVRVLVGHGVGRVMHEEPTVPNFDCGFKGEELRKGMVIAIEPMINLRTFRVYQLDDGWTYVTGDHKPSAHFEHTVAITDGEPRILTNGID
ncbi:type I methionyl aminopeptidase [bacterium]|nr:type I methionyl aminopeptidase [bacterium]